MPLFSRFKSKGAQPAKGKEQTALSNGTAIAPHKPRFQTIWQSKTVVLEEVQELVHACTAEMKLRAEALDSPFLLLPFRPDTDPSGARSFIRNFYKANSEGSAQYRGAGLQQELRLADTIVLCSVLKWCWSRIPGGVVSWPVYEGFQIGERESNLARNAFDTFIPIGAASEARKSIIFDFFDALAAVAAHGKLNGLGGRKLSRLAGWWAFEYSDEGNGFEGGYKLWTAAADATSHLFFAYLRSLSPEAEQALALIERIPRSLQALLASTEYPPERPTLLQRSTPRVVMLVDTVSPTPFALLRRAKHFEFRERDRVLREYSEFEDPLDALTDECKRVLYAISSTNSAAALSRHGPVAKTGQESWNAFQSLGFSDLDDKSLQTVDRTPGSPQSGLRSQARSRHANHGRPTTPSWADFLSSGFAEDDVGKAPSTLSLPYDKVLPPLGSRTQTPAYSIPGEDESLAPGELAAVTDVDLDDAFWWVWMTSLAAEETSDRKGVFGRCALIETSIMNGRWLIMEEQVKGASPDPAEGAYLVPKKSLFSFTKRGRNKKSKLAAIPAPPVKRATSTTSNRTGLAPDQQDKIKAAAAALTRKQNGDDVASMTGRRGRTDEATATKTSSVLTSGMLSEASPAMKWASAYDKHAIRAQYLGDAFAGKGASREDLVRRASPINLNGDGTSANAHSSSGLLPAATAYLTDTARARHTPVVAKDDAATAGAESADALGELNNKVVTALPTVPSTRSQAVTDTPIAHLPAADEDADDEDEEEPTSRATAAAASSALDKELAVDTPSKAEKVERKPVPVQAHPALRPQTKDGAPGSNVTGAEPQTPTSPTNAAAIAAARAMAANTSSPESQKLKKQPSGASGFKKLFGRKQEKGRDSFETRPSDNRASLSPPSETNLGRRLSLMRKKPASKAAPAQVSAPESAPETFQEPTASHNQFDDVSRVVSRSDANAEEEFSRFDQGPTAYVPAAPIEHVEDSEGEAIPAPVPRHYNTALASRIAPEQHDVEPASATSMEHSGHVDDDVQSETMMEEQQPPRSIEPAQDRWAQIRDNAAKRAARASEEQSMQSRQTGHSTRETDDGETSGEETIESRVARIKARVAELTGNIEGSSTTLRR